MAYTRTIGTAVSAAGGNSLSVPLPDGTLEGKLLLIIAGNITSSSVPGTAPTGYTQLGTLTTDDPQIVWGKIAGGSESAPTVNAWSSGGHCAFMLAIDSPQGWPVIGSVLAGVSTSKPAAGTGARYAAHVVIGNGNCLLRATVKNGTLDATPTAVAVTSGYTAAGFANRVANCLIAAEMLTAVTEVGVNASDTDAAVSPSSASTNRAGLTLELAPAPSAATSISIDDAVPNPGDAIVITKAEGAFAGTVTVELTDNNGANVDVSSAVTGSGATRTLTLPAVTSFDDANATWEKIRWGQVLTLTVTDDDGSDTETLTITPPVSDHFAALAGTAVYITSPGTTADDIYVHIVSGNGEGLPEISSHQGNTVPTVVNFMCFDVSADKWLAATVHTFDTASAASDGELYDAFTGVNGTDLDAHTPDTQIASRMWVIAKALTTNDAPGANTVEIQSNLLKVTSAGGGGEYNVGTVNPDITERWTPTADDHRLSIHGRRLDVSNYIQAFIRKDGIISLSQRESGSLVSLEGETTYNFGVAFTAGVEVRARLRIDGNQIGLSVNDIEYLLCTTPIAANAAATKIGLFAGGADYIANGVKFGPINVYSDYDPNVRTISFNATTYSPGDVITCTVVGNDFAGTIDEASIDGVSYTPGAADLNSCTLTLAGYDEFDAAGDHVATGFYRNVTVVIADAGEVTTTATGTIQIVVPTSANYGTVTSGTQRYPVAGANDGHTVYVRLVSGSGTATPGSFDFDTQSDAVVHFMVFDEERGEWLARREQTVYRPITFGAVVA